MESCSDRRTGACDRKAQGFLARRAGRLRSLQHVISAGCGVVALYWFFGEVLVYLLVLALLSYPLLRLTRLKCTAWSGKALACIALVYLLTWSVCIKLRLPVTQLFLRSPQC